MMVELLSFATFAGVLAVSILTIVATIKAELPHIVRALGGDAITLPPVQSTRAPRIRVTRPLRAAERRSLRAAA